MKYDSYIWLLPSTTIGSECIAFQRICTGTVMITKTVHPASKPLYTKKLIMSLHDK